MRRQRRALNNSPLRKVNKSASGKKNNVSDDGEEKESPNKTSDINDAKNVTSNLDHDSSNEIQKEATILPITPAPCILPSVVRRPTREEEFQQIVQQKSDNPDSVMAARNNRPRAGFAKPEQGAAAQEEMNMWETIKADMMRAHNLKTQSDEKMRQQNELKARIGDLRKSKFMSVLRMSNPL
jgi:hypothetical protein